MKRLLQILVAVLVTVGITGCASPYMVDRGRDAADIFTATVGVGIGAKARVGPVQLPLIMTVDAAGLRGGEFFAPPPRSESSANGYIEFLVEGGASGLEIAEPIPLYSSYFNAIFSGMEGFNTHGVMVERHKDIDAIGFGPVAYEYSGCDKCGDPTHWPYYTQIEGCLALGLSIRLGFNPGELLDFILGWTTIDIFSDDIEAKKHNKTSDLPRKPGDPEK